MRAGFFFNYIQKYFSVLVPQVSQVTTKKHRKGLRSSMNKNISHFFIIYGASHIFLPLNVCWQSSASSLVGNLIPTVSVSNKSLALPFRKNLLGLCECLIKMNVFLSHLKKSFFVFRCGWVQTGQMMRIPSRGHLGRSPKSVYSAVLLLQAQKKINTRRRHSGDGVISGRASWGVTRASHKSPPPRIWSDNWLKHDTCEHDFRSFTIRHPLARSKPTDRAPGTA